jgi:hypothetical protein
MGAKVAAAALWQVMLEMYGSSLSGVSMWQKPTKVPDGLQ